jgi:hypothetical protein
MFQTTFRRPATNSRYWYRRADRLDRVNDEPRAELAAIKTELTTAGRDESRNAGEGT